MIYFEKLRWKNFLSTGNAFTEVDFTRSPSTLIVGDNGAGKSTFLDALCFGLFNKPFRNINKPQLVNSVNQKGLVVEVEFRIGKSDYKVIRGVKPNIFEVHRDGEMVDQDAALRDTQKYLEESVLNLNYKSFTQIVILGSASFTPFMQLPAHIRREVIEDILDIQIFTTMNGLLKEQINGMQGDIREIESKVEVAKQRAIIQKRYIEQLENNKAEKISEIEGEIDELGIKIQGIKKVSDEKSGKAKGMGDPTRKRRKLETLNEKFISQVKKINKELDFYENHDDCPTCKQSIPVEHKKEIQSERTEKIKELEGASKEMQTEFDRIDVLIKEYTELQSQIIEANNEITTNQKYLQRLIAELADTRKHVADIETEQEKLKDLAKEVTSANKIRSDKNEEMHYMQAVSALLKDTGIKTRIIKQYLPAINTLANKYLAAMDFFVNFNLDEKFNETIKSRGRDKFSYASFSEGEKQRIDLALLFTWRTIAKMKNSASTNLLILDEVFDSSLDNNGTDYVMTLLNTIGDDTNVFVISHKGDQLFDKFRSIIKFEKRQNYSVMV